MVDQVNFDGGRQNSTREADLGGCSVVSLSLLSGQEEPGPHCGQQKWAEGPCWQLGAAQLASTALLKASGALPKLWVSHGVACLGRSRPHLPSGGRAGAPTEAALACGGPPGPGRGDTREGSRRSKGKSVCQAAAARTGEARRPQPCPQPAAASGRGPVRAPGLGAGVSEDQAVASSRSPAW